MEKDRAFEILSLQLCSAQMDNKRSWKKDNFIEALKVALEVLNEKIEKESRNVKRRSNI